MRKIKKTIRQKKIRDVFSKAKLFRLFFFALLYSLPIPTSGQKYNFIQFSVGEGLAQSQPSSFIQNNNNELFIGSLGGLSRFDGTHFQNYNRSHGLAHNLVISLAIDTLQQVWVGTPNGISRFNGTTFDNFEILNPKGEKTLINQIAVDAENIVWAIGASKLYQLRDRKITAVNQNDTTIALTVDKSGKLWVFNFRKGLFVWDGKEWHREINTSENGNLIIFRMQFGNFSGTLYCLTAQGLKIPENEKLVTPEWMKNFPSSAFINAVLEDSKGNIWIATSEGGAWMYNRENWIYYDFENGFSDEVVSTIFEDNEGNIWLATDGAGIFRFAGNDFTYFDRSSGLSSPSVMSITQNLEKELYIIDNNNGFYKIDKDGLSGIKPPASITKINKLFTDSKGLVWLGTAGGLWTYAAGRFDKFPSPDNIHPLGIIDIAEFDNSLWIAGRNGVFTIRNNKITRENINLNAYTLQVMGPDTLFLGTLNGVYIYNIQTKTLVPRPFLPDATVLSLAADSRRLYIGTDARGVVIWNRKDQHFTTLDQEAGLSCNYVYSLLKDNANNLWVGTGCGIDKITFYAGAYKIENFGQSNGLKGLENNANAAFEDYRGYLWFGTNSALFRYNPYLSAKKEKKTPTRIILQSVKLFSKDIMPDEFSDSTLPFSNIPYYPVFQPRQNHITFTFKGICLSNPDRVKYRYQLIGIEQQFTETNQNTVVYANLPSGKFVFKVWATDVDGNWTEHALTYPFVIITPFSSTIYFKIALALLFIALFFGGVYYRNHRQKRRLRWAEKLREEEQARIRQKTAEDFHDEIGNKLTRINLLTTIVEDKTKNAPNDIKHLLHQIKTNVTSLYKGSKDIIWSLQPQSDYLDEIIWKIRQNTTEMLEDSDIQFQFEEFGEWSLQTKLPIDYSRNLIMIFKEAVNNMVKHSGARHLKMTVYKELKHVIFEFKDDGIGFSFPQEGNGLHNMQNRAQRINGDLKIKSSPNTGTLVYLQLNIHSR